MRFRINKRATLHDLIFTHQACYSVEQLEKHVFKGRDYVTLEDVVKLHIPYQDKDWFFDAIVDYRGSNATDYRLDSPRDCNDNLGVYGFSQEKYNADHEENFSHYVSYMLLCEEMDKDGSYPYVDNFT